MKSFLSRTFVDGDENTGFLGKHGYGSLRFKTTEDVEREARAKLLGKMREA